MSKVTLGEVATESRESYRDACSDAPRVGLENISPEEIVLKSYDEGKDNTFNKIFRKGDVLFGRRRAYLKKASVAPFDGICSGDITVIRANPDAVCPQLLPFVIHNDRLFDFAVGKSAGSLSPRVKWEHLKNYEFELPERGKQEQLAKTLWSIERTKEAYQKLMIATDEVVKSQFVEMFGVPLLNNKRWKTRKLLEVAPALPYEGSVDKFKNRCWLLNLDMIESNTGRIIQKVYVTEDEVGSSTAAFTSDHVLYSKLRPYLNKVVTPDSSGYATTELIPLLPNKDYLNRTYLAQMLRGDAFLSFVNAHTVGTRMPRVLMSEFWGFDVMLPPMEMQEEFAGFVRQSNKSKFELEQALAELAATYKRIIEENLG